MPNPTLCQQPELDHSDPTFFRRTIEICLRNESYPNMDALQESGWEELWRKAQKVESDLDVKLSNYAKIGARVTQGSPADGASPTTGSWKSMEMEIQSLLEKLLDINDS